MIAKLINAAAPCRFRAKILEERPAPDCAGRAGLSSGVCPDTARSNKATRRAAVD